MLLPDQVQLCQELSAAVFYTIRTQIKTAFALLFQSLFFLKVPSQSFRRVHLSFSCLAAMGVWMLVLEWLDHLDHTLSCLSMSLALLFTLPKSNC